MNLQMPEKPRDQTVHEGESAVFACRLNGYPEPMLTWLHDGEPIKNPNCVINRDNAGRCMLLVQRVTSRDVGMYTVRAINVHGMIQASAYLNMLGENSMCFASY